MRLALALTLLATGCAHLLVATPGEVYDDAEAPGARLVTRGELALVEVQGTPDEIGEQLGALVAGPMQELQARFFEYVPPTPARRAAALLAALPADHARELQALARAAGVRYEDALVGNVIVDSACTAFVASGAATRTGELLFARNMDFPPAHLVGPATLVLLVRPEGKKAFVSVGWPGVTGVVSGMNQDGLCAAILLNFGGRGGKADGVPLTYLVREALETCASVEEARDLLRARTPASAHFVFLADAAAGLIVAPGEPDRAPRDGVLTCSNDGFAPLGDVQTDRRARALVDLVHEHRGRLDPDLARGILGATYLDYINAQAMVFEPAARRLSLATGTTLRPAALQDWTRLDVAAAFAGGWGDDVEVQELDDADAFPHYLEHPYRGEPALRRFLDAVEREAARIEADAALDEVTRLIAWCQLLRDARLQLGPEEAEAPSRALAARLMGWMERQATAMETAPGAVDIVQRGAFALRAFGVPLSPEQERRRAALELRADALQGQGSTQRGPDSAGG